MTGSSGQAERGSGISEQVVEEANVQQMSESWIELRDVLRMEDLTLDLS